MKIAYKYMNKAVVTFSIAVLALAGCESDSSGSSSRLSSRVLAQTAPSTDTNARGDAAFITAADTAANADDSFRISNTVTDDDTNQIMVIRRQ